MTSGKIVEWNKSVGDKIESGDSLLIVETDKSCIDFDMQTEGYLAYKSPLTDNISIGQPIAIIVEDPSMVDKFSNFSFDEVPGASESSSEPAPQETPSTSEPNAAQAELSLTEKAPSRSVIASPSAKRIAKSMNIDINTIKGSGPGGRIVNADVIAPQSKKATPPAPPPTPTPLQPAPVHVPSADYVDVSLTPMRNAIIRNLAKTKVGTPDFSVSLNAKMDKLLEMRERFNEKSFGAYKITVNDMIIKVACAVLKSVPEMNAHFNGDSIRRFKTINMCIAMAAEDGLYAPVLRAVNEKGLIEISNGVKELAKKTKAGKLSQFDLVDGTFTISNLGMYSIESFNSILVNPQVGILSVGVAKKVPEQSATDPEKFVMTTCANFTLTSDHRAIDGHVAAKWLQEFKKVIEDPNMILL